jgi:hypothetical protein
MNGGVYTAKKTLPRLLIAAILINLSIYIAAAAVDVTNVIGAGLSEILLSPFGNNLIIKPSVASDAVFGVGASTAVVGGALAVFGLGGPAIAALSSLVGAALPAILLFVVLPLVIGLVTAFTVLALRQAFIIAFAIFSPIIFALWALPNTEKIGVKAISLFFKMLVLYWIAIIIFVGFNIIAVIFGNGHIFGPFGAIVALFLQGGSLLFFLIAFRFADKATATIYQTMTGGGKRLHEFAKGNQNDQNSLQNATRRNLTSAVNRVRAQGYRSIIGRRPGGSHRVATRFLAGALEKESALNRASKERLAYIKDHGDDRIVNARASFIDNAGIYGRRGARRTLNGAEVNQADWIASQRILPSINDVQAISDYRSTKIDTTEEAHEFARNFGLMSQQMGLTADEATSNFTALAFARQHERGEFKFGQFVRAANGSYSFHAPGDVGSFEGDINPATGNVVAEGASRSGNFLKSQYSHRGSYDGAKMFSSYFQSMGDIKQAHLDRIASGRLSPRQEQRSRDQLKQIMEIEDAFVRGGSYRDPNTGQMIDGGLSGANAETQAAFLQMRLIGTSGPVAPTAGSGRTGAGVGALTNPELIRIRGEIDSGQTYEAAHSPAPGDFSPGARAYT